MNERSAINPFIHTTVLPPKETKTLSSPLSSFSTGTETHSSVVKPLDDIPEALRLPNDSVNKKGEANQVADKPRDEEEVAAQTTTTTTTTTATGKYHPTASACSVGGGWGECQGSR